MDKLIRKAALSSLTMIFYNINKGLVSVYLAALDKTLALVGFGLDSFVEVIS